MCLKFVFVLYVPHTFLGNFSRSSLYTRHDALCETDGCYTRNRLFWASHVLEHFQCEDHTSTNESVFNKYNEPL